MKKYQLFDVIDFAQDEAFVRWVKDKHPEDEFFWTEWLALHPEKTPIVTEAIRLVEGMVFNQDAVSEEEVDAAVNQLLLNIQHHPGRKRGISFRWMWMAAAACIILGAVSIYYISFKEDRSSKFSYASVASSKKLVEQFNASNKTMTIQLPDGSNIVLWPNSRICYENGFEETPTRDVFLLGQAFFEVKKNPNKPFRVFTNEIVTRVLGTSFMVRSFEQDPSISISVRTGKVNVYSQSDPVPADETKFSKPGGIVLTPNQKIVYKKELGSFEKSLTETPVMIDSTISDRSLKFVDEPVTNVLERIKKAYGIQLIYDAELLKPCTITVDLAGESLYSKFDLICSAIGATYEIVDAQVVIQTPGCR